MVLTEPVFHSDGVEEAVVNDKPKLAIGAFDEHTRSGGFRFGVAIEAVSQVRLDVLFDGDQLWGGHGVDGTPRGN